MEGAKARPAACGRSLSLVIPAFNEADGIQQAIAEADTAIAQLTDDYEIIVVDDGSNDRTTEQVTEAAKARPGVRLIRHSSNRGYGAALKTGFQAARYERVAFTDADCQFHLSDLDPLLDITDEKPIAVGYRVDRQDPWRRKFFSWGYNRLTRALLGAPARDCDCALKVFRRDALEEILPETDGFFVNVEMLTRARQKGLDVGEIGVRHRPRLAGGSKVSLWDIPRTLRALLPFWWSEELFPGPTEELVPSPSPIEILHGADDRRITAWYPLLLLIICAGLLFFSRLGSPLQEPEESRYAEISRQMLASNQWLVPVLHGEPYYDKPPLLYWLVMGSYKIFGVADWSARLIPSLAGLFTVLVTYWWGRRTAGKFPAFVGAAILALSVRFIYLGRLLTMNSLLCLCVVCALAAGHCALARGRFRWHLWLASAAACGMGLLTKGPVAALLVLIPLFVLQALDRRIAKPQAAIWLAYLGLSAALAAPWYVAVALRDPDFLVHFFWRHNLVRYLMPFDHAKPTWYYLTDIIFGMLPWTLLLPSFVVYLCRRRSKDRTARPQALGLFILAAGWCILFYSFAGSKRSGYILPALAPFALALGCYVDGMVQALIRSEALRAIERACYWAFRMGMAILAAALCFSLLGVLAGYLKPISAVLVAGVAILSWLGIRRWALNRDWVKAWTTCAAASFAMLFLAIVLTFPGHARRYSIRGQVRQFAQLTQDPGIRVVSYPRRWDSVSFYLRRDDVQVYAEGQRAQLIAAARDNRPILAFIKADQALQELLRELPPSLEFLPYGRQGSVAVGWLRPRPVVPDGYLAALVLSIRIPILA
jgi:dolichol-phosphate mannosyltransferase